MTRPNKRKDAAEAALIEAAERIFGQDGIEAASLRAIAKAAGSENSYAVQYHFGNRQGLVDAIFARRLAAKEVRRAAMLADPGFKGDVRGLLEVIWRPLFEQRDSTGRHSYAMFLLGLRRSEVGFGRRVEVDMLAPVVLDAINRVAAALPHLPDAVCRLRISLISSLVLDAIERLDSGSVVLGEESLLQELLDTATAYISTPSPVN